MDRKKLCTPFPRELVRTRPGQHGKQLSYVPTQAIVDRMNEAIGAWDFYIDEHSVQGDEVVVLGRLVADGITKSAFGGSTLTYDRDGKVVALGDSMKGAASDALKKAASLLGVPIGGGHEEGTPSAEVESAHPVAEQRPELRTEQVHRPSFGGATVKQLSAINAASRRCGFDQRRLAEFVSQEAGKRDVSHLSREEASRLIDRLNTIPRGGVSH